MDQIGGKILLFVSLAFLFITVIVGIVYPMVSGKTTQVQTTINGTKTSFNYQLNEHPTLGTRYNA